MNAKEVRAINDEYERLEGTVTREVTTKLWDRASNCYYVARCVVIDLGRRPPVTPYALTQEDRELMGLRGAAQQQQQYRAVPAQPRNTEAPETLSKRLHAWMKEVGAATNYQAAQAVSITAEQAKHLLTSNAHLFRPWKKIARQSYFVAI